MNPLTTIRQRQIPWARRALGMFIVVWLNMALLPCALAIDEINEHDCTQCPPFVSGEMPSCDAHAAHNKMLQSVPCDADVAQCGIYDEYNYDGRTVQVKLKDTPGDGYIAIVSPVATIPVAGLASVLGLDESTQRSSIPIPLNILYCVYLN